MSLFDAHSAKSLSYSILARARDAKIRKATPDFGLFGSISGQVFSLFVDE